MASLPPLAGAVFLALALRLLRAGDGPGSDAAAKALFGYSILYLFALFAAMLIENRVHVFFGMCSGSRERERRTDRG